MKMSRKKVISRARLSSTLRKFSKKYVSFRPPFWLGPTFFLHSPQLCPNRVCPTLNSIHSDFGAKRKFLPNLENFRLSRPGTLGKIFFRQNFFFSNRLGYVLIVFARPQIVSPAILGPIGVGRQT